MDQLRLELVPTWFVGDGLTYCTAGLDFLSSDSFQLAHLGQEGTTRAVGVASKEASDSEIL